MEAELLSCFQHPHIIKIRGVAFHGPDSFMHGPERYFLIIDRLSETLECRIKYWSTFQKGSKIKPRNILLAKGCHSQDGKGEDSIMEEQINVAISIAAAVKYMHSKRVVFRDLKPTNIGFDGESMSNISSFI